MQIKNILKNVDKEINSYSYKKALELDKRTYFQYYFSLLKTKHIFFFAFIPSKDYNLTIIKIYLFFFSFVLFLTVNALFFNDSTMHKIYVDEGTFNFIYQLPQILYSTIISSIITIIVKKLSLNEEDILNIKNQNKKEKLTAAFAKEVKIIMIKFIIFSFFNILFLSMFWYYLGCFCSVYRNTQVHLITDTIISFGLSLLYPLGLNLLPGLLRIPALRAKNKDKECLYKISKLVQLI